MAEENDVGRWSLLLQKATFSIESIVKRRSFRGLDVEVNTSRSSVRVERICSVCGVDRQQPRKLLRMSLRVQKPLKAVSVKVLFGGLDVSMMEV